MTSAPSLWLGHFGCYCRLLKCRRFRRTLLLLVVLQVLGVHACAPGQKLVGASCVACEPGTAGTSGDIDGCPSCPVDHYQSDPGQTECLLVPPGSVTDTAKRNKIFPCPLGYSCPGGDALPALCSPGYYSDALGAVECDEVPAGSFTNVTLPSSISLCPEGSMCPAKSTSPVQCPAGSFQPLEGQADCNDCVAGTSSEAGATKCFYCPPDSTSYDGGSCFNCSELAGVQYCSPVTLSSGLIVLQVDDCPDGSYISVPDLRLGCKKCPSDYTCDGTTKRTFSPLEDGLSSHLILSIILLLVVVVIYCLAVLKRKKTVTEPQKLETPVGTPKSSRRSSMSTSSRSRSSRLGRAHRSTMNVPQVMVARSTGELGAVV